MQKGANEVTTNILSVIEKLPVSKFLYFGKYIMQLYGYFWRDKTVPQALELWSM